MTSYRLEYRYKLWSERENKQDATVRCLLSTLSQHVSGIIMPIFRRTKTVCYCMRCAALVLLDVVGSGCVDNTHLTVASCWFSLSLHNLLTMHGHRNLKIGTNVLKDNWRIKNQLDATYYFIVLLRGSTCFGHYCAHHQKLATIMLITTLVVSFLVCSRLEVRCG